MCVWRRLTHFFIFLVNRVQEPLKMWRSQAHRTRKPNLWRLVSVQHHLCLNGKFKSLVYFLHSVWQLAAVQEISRHTSRTSPSRRRRRTGRGRRRSGNADRPKRSRSERKRSVRSKRGPKPPPPSRAPVPLLQSSQPPVQRTR